jgi:hypothetical protein
LLRITIVCSDACDGWPCFECEMMDEAIAMAAQGSPNEKQIEFAHQSVQEAMQAWTGKVFNDLDAPYFMVGDEVKLHGREWRSASVDSVVSILSMELPRK